MDHGDRDERRARRLLRQLERRRERRAAQPALRLQATRAPAPDGGSTACGSGCVTAGGGAGTGNSVAGRTAQAARQTAGRRAAARRAAAARQRRSGGTAAARAVRRRLRHRRQLRGRRDELRSGSEDGVGHELPDRSDDDLCRRNLDRSGSTTNDPLVCESAHFAVHAPDGTITAQQCSDATDTLENVVWPTLFGGPIFFPEPYCTSTQKHKASIVVHTDYGLTGGGWGNGTWACGSGPAAPPITGASRTSSCTPCNRTPRASSAAAVANNYCGWIYESHANWRSQQLPEYHTSNVHCSELLGERAAPLPRLDARSLLQLAVHGVPEGQVLLFGGQRIWPARRASNDPFNNI